jgi:hypothetical protein
MQTNLKTLSRQYANGLLTKADYRQARADLIETAQDNDHTEPQVTVPQNTTDDEDPGSEPSDKEGWQSHSPRPPPETTQEPNKQCKRRNQFLLVLVLVLVAALGYLTLA